MPNDDVRTRFELFSADLTARVATDPEVLGLVLVGSTADTDRVDEWSDHDFILVTREGTQEAFRQDLGWLPGAEHLVLRVRETAHGLKAVYDDGRVLEFAVFSPDEVPLAEANAYRVALDRADLTATMAQIAARPRPGAVVDDEREIALFLSLVLIGVGRARRGELIAAGQHLRSHALRHLLTAWRHRHPTPDDARLDDLDVFRRVELVHPEAAARIATAQAGDPETCARALLDLAEEQLAPGWTGWPTEAVTAVRHRLGWS